MVHDELLALPYSAGWAEACSTRHCDEGLCFERQQHALPCPAGRQSPHIPGYQEAVGCEEVSNQGQVFEAHEQGGNRRAIACVISGIEGRKQVRAAAPALLGEMSVHHVCRGWISS